MIKSKKSKSPKKLNVSPYSFLFLWVIGAPLGWLAVTPLANALIRLPIDLSMFPFWIFWVGLGSVIGLGATSGQMLALRAGKGRWYWQWGIVSLIGWALGGLSLTMMDRFFSTGYPLIDSTLAIIGLTGFAALFQSMLMHQWVRNSWLWLLGIVTSSAIFSMIVENATGGIFSAVMAFAGYGIVTGLVMLWLLLVNARSAPALQAQIQDMRLDDAEIHLADTIEQTEDHTNYRSKRQRSGYAQ